MAEITSCKPFDEAEAANYTLEYFHVEAPLTCVVDSEWGNLPSEG